MRLKISKKKTLWGSEKTIETGLPVCIKILNAKKKLSVQVHPTGELKKDEFWYVLSARKNAEIILGTSREVTKEELKKRAEDGTIVEILRRVKVKKGDSFYLPGGTIHALGAGIKVLEIASQNDITYRLFDWGRGRELHLEKALEFAKLTPSNSKRTSNKSAIKYTKIPVKKGEINEILHRN
jgi:mannose-6-phosphate isomerase